MDSSTLQLGAVFIVVTIASIFSGMAGGGGAVIVVPFLISIGMSPQQAVATIKFASFGAILGSVAAFKKKSFENPKLLVFLMAMTALISLSVPFIFKKLSSDTFQLAIGLIMIVLIPASLSKKHGMVQTQTSKPRKIVGSFLLAIVFLLQGVFSSGVGALNNTVLSSFFGLTTLQASAIRRVAVLTLNIFIVISLITTTNFINYKYAVTTLVASLIGAYAGSRIALKRGDQFVKYAMAGFMLVSGIALIVSAL